MIINEVQLVDGIDWRGCLRLVRTGHHMAKYQYVEYSKHDISHKLIDDKCPRTCWERICWESREVYTEYCEGTEDCLFAVKSFLKDKNTQDLINRLQSEDDLRGKHLVENFYKGMVEVFCTI